MKLNWKIIALVVIVYFVIRKSSSSTSSSTTTSTNSPSTSTSTDKKLTKLIWFYADWCGHCKYFSPEWDKFVSANRNKSIELVKQNGDEDKDGSLHKKYNVTGYPTVVMLYNDNTSEHYEGPRKADALSMVLNSKM